MTDNDNERPSERAMRIASRQPNFKRQSTIDFTPSWRAVLPAILLALDHGGDEGKRIAKEELARMAEAADAYNASVPK